MFTYIKAAALLKTYRHSWSGGKWVWYEWQKISHYSWHEMFHGCTKCIENNSFVGVLGAALSRPTSASDRTLGTGPCRWRQKHWGIMGENGWRNCLDDADTIGHPILTNGNERKLCDRRRRGKLRGKLRGKMEMRKIVGEWCKKREDSDKFWGNAGRRKKIRKHFTVKTQLLLYDGNWALLFHIVLATLPPINMFLLKKVLDHETLNPWVLKTGAVFPYSHVNRRQGLPWRPFGSLRIDRIWWNRFP